jgi:hypothetical protein
MLVKTIASETGELSGMRIAASRGRMMPARQRVMATAL